MQRKRADRMSFEIGCGLLGVSYVLLLVGLFGDLVDYQYAVTADPEWFKGRQDEALFEKVLPFIQDKPLPVIPETTRSLMGGDAENLGLVQWLWKEAVAGRCSYVAPSALVFFGLGIPCLKLALFIAWAKGRGPQWLMAAATQLSRWAAVDAVAEAMLVAFLMKAGLDAKHCVGFVCFVGYCIVSAVAFWYFEDSASPGTRGALLHLGAKSFNGHPGRILIVITTVLFVVLLGVGVTYPLGNLRIPEESLRSNALVSIEPMRPMLAFVGIVDTDVDKLVNGFVDVMPKPECEASVLAAVTTLLSSGHFFTCVGSALLFLGVLFLPLMEAVLLAILAWRSPAIPEEKPLQNATDPEIKSLIVVLNAVSDLVLLDVFVVGMFVAVVVLSSVEVLHAELLQGYYILVGAVLAAGLHQIVCGGAINTGQMLMEEGDPPRGSIDARSVIRPAPV